MLRGDHKLGCVQPLCGARCSLIYTHWTKEYRNHLLLHTNRQFSIVFLLLATNSDADEAHARLAEAATELDASEARCRELEGKLSLLGKKAENARGEERLKVA